MAQDGNQKRKEFAVIYGVTSRAAQGMAKYLVNNGHHLILIDKDENALEASETEIKKDLDEAITQDLEVYKLHMAIFDEDRIQ